MSALTTLEFLADKFETVLLPLLPGHRRVGDFKWEQSPCPHCKAGSVTLEVTETGKPLVECSSGCGYIQILSAVGLSRSEFEQGIEQTQISQKLDPRHREELHRSGLSDEYIDRLGWYTETSIPKVRHLLGNKRFPKPCCSGIVFAYPSIQGGSSDYCEFKPDQPRANRKNGKIQKYEAPPNVPRRVFIPPDTFDKLNDPTIELVITEGVKKAASLDHHGIPAIGLGGVDCSRKKDHAQLNRDMTLIAWKGRPVVIVFDSDSAENPNVMRAANQLAAMLRSYGAIVRLANIPAGESTTEGKPAKVGADDYIVSKGAAEMRAVIDAAVDPGGLEVEPEKVNAKVLDQVPTVQQFAEVRHSIKRGSELVWTLRFWRESWWQWSKSSGSYIEISEWQVTTQLYKYLHPFASHITQRAIGDLRYALKAMLFLRDETDMPAWINQGPDSLRSLPASDFIAAKNGLLHVPSLIAGAEDPLHCHTPDFWCANALSVDYDTNAPEPVEWLRFLSSIWPDDPASIATLAEIFGYLVTSDTRQQKIFFLVGPPRSGKGTISQILTALVGKKNVINPSFASLDGTFSLEPFIGKTIACISDAHLSGRTDQVRVVERLKSISGEGDQTIERKNKSAVTMRLPTRFFLMSNELPRFTDSSGAFASRLVMLVMKKSFIGKEDLRLEQRLMAELPSILRWALEGLERLMARGSFSQPATGNEMVAEMKDLSSPVRTFIRERCIVDEAAAMFPTFVWRDVLYDAWQRWCDAHGKKPTDEPTFERDIRAAFPQISSKQRRRDDGRARTYEGLSLIDGPSEEHQAAGQVEQGGTCDFPTQRELKDNEYQEGGNGEQTNGALKVQFANKEHVFHPVPPVQSIANHTGIPTFEAAYSADLQHRHVGCRALVGWQHRHIGAVCLACYPPTDITAVVVEGDQV